MYCINCWNDDTRVIDSRTSEDGKSIRRRRECGVCHNRFTTYEKREALALMVEKKGDKKERYERLKLEDSILKATNKRNVSILKINQLIRNLELKWSTKTEITSKQIWTDVMKGLSMLDEVSYVRYASVHLRFEKSSDFISFINKES